MAEGKAVIVMVYKPPNFIPNKAFGMSVRAENEGGSDLMFARITNIDTGEIIVERVIFVLGGNGWDCPCFVTLTQTTDFHGRVEVGHVE